MSDQEICDQIRARIVTAIPDAKVEVNGGSGHFSIGVTSSQFAGKRVLEQHRMVLTAISDLMAGLNAPVHAVDSLQTRTP